MKNRQTQIKDDFVSGFEKLDAFTRAHPELKDALGLWMADRGTCEAIYPEAAELFKRDLNEF